MVRKSQLNQFIVLIFVVFVFIIDVARGEKEEDSGGGGNNSTLAKRKGKYFSVFNVVKFGNHACDGGSKNGTCYTAPECEERGGANAGSCAGGFGVCCTITLSCGATSSENCTYFESSGITSGVCSATICPCNDNICQMRLDFVSFTIAGPSTLTSSTATIAKGVGARVGSVSVATASRCLTDSFSVVGTGSAGRPSICGTNTGEHMYIDTDGSGCDMLTFNFGSAGVGTDIPNRAFSIKVTQYSCGFPNLAPQGCTQYFFGSTSGSFQSYNYNRGNGRHLDQQDQAICFRICYYAVTPTDFQVSGGIFISASAFTSRIGINDDGLCGSYASSVAMGFDFINIPHAVRATDGGALRSNFCGRNAGLITSATSTTSAGASASVCSTVTPFIVNFRSDGYEGTSEVRFTNSGFNLGYTLDAINCQ